MVGAVAVSNSQGRPRHYIAVFISQSSPDLTSFHLNSEQSASQATQFAVTKTNQNELRHVTSKTHKGRNWLLCDQLIVLTGRSHG